MDLNFQYQCKGCGDCKDCKSLESFICECGGEFVLRDNVMVDVFEPYYDETLKKRIHSAPQRDREFRKAGLYVSQDDKKMVRRWADQRKYKEDIFQETARRDGKSYKPGSGKAWSEKHQDFVHPRHL